jgi:RimJ/RimL family protein N-acetyltransferase
MTLERETAWYDGLHGGSGEIGFTVYERGTWRPIGNTGLHGVDHRNRTAAFGVLIGEPDRRGKGYGTEVTRLMLDYAFSALGLHSVMLTVYEFNLAAQRVYRKAGFREIGRRRQCRLMGGRLWDEVYMDCLATEFESPLLARLFRPDEPRP